MAMQLYDPSPSSGIMPSLSDVLQSNMHFLRDSSLADGEWMAAFQ
jgi:hypothetical protein